MNKKVIELYKYLEKNGYKEEQIKLIKLSFALPLALPVFGAATLIAIESAAITIGLTAAAYIAYELWKSNIDPTVDVIIEYYRNNYADKPIPVSDLKDVEKLIRREKKNPIPEGKPPFSPIGDKKERVSNKDNIKDEGFEDYDDNKKRMNIKVTCFKVGENIVKPAKGIYSGTAEFTTDETELWFYSNHNLEQERYADKACQWWDLTSALNMPTSYEDISLSSLIESAKTIRLFNRSLKHGLLLKYPPHIFFDWLSKLFCRKSGLSLYSLTLEDWTSESINCIHTPKRKNNINYDIYLGREIIKTYKKDC